jgi:hypothetical protein
MNNDGGLISRLEQWFADELAALEYEGAKVFPAHPGSSPSADVWKYQVAAIKGGLESFERYASFAFVSFLSADGAREGDYDLRQVLEFAIVIGVTSKVEGVARFGDATHLGIGKIRDLVIALFDKRHPGGTLKCDEIYYTGEIILVDAPKVFAIQMHFETSFLTVP